MQGLGTTGFARFINDVIQNASEFPGVIRNFAGDVNSDLIDDATRQQVEQNLREGEAQKYGSSFASWLSVPQNLIMAFVGVVGFILLIRKL